MGAHFVEAAPAAAVKRFFEVRVVTRPARAPTAAYADMLVLIFGSVGKPTGESERSRKGQGPRVGRDFNTCNWHLARAGM